MPHHEPFGRLGPQLVVSLGLAGKSRHAPRSDNESTASSALRGEANEIVEERYDRKSTIVTSQLPIKAWHDSMEDPTLADAILDRLVHNAHKVELDGGSMRKIKTALDRKPGPVTL